MIIAKVSGTVVSNQKTAKMEGLKLLLLEKIDRINRSKAKVKTKIIQSTCLEYPLIQK